MVLDKCIEVQCRTCNNIAWCRIDQQSYTGILSVWHMRYIAYLVCMYSGQPAVAVVAVVTEAERWLYLQPRA